MPAILQRTRAQLTTGGFVVVAAACAGVIAVVLTLLHRYGAADLALNRGAITSWLSGDELYAYRSARTHLGAALPPPAAFALVPIAFLPLRAGAVLIALSGVVALVLAVFALAVPVARRYGRRPWPMVGVATVLALTIEPVRAALGLGDLDLVLFGLITADVVALRRGAWARSRAAWWPGWAASMPDRDRPLRHLLRRGWSSGAWAGVGIGLATALAVGPGLFIVYLGLTRQWRAAFTALGTAGTLAAGALMLAPQDAAAWFGDVLWRLDRTGAVNRVGNQSLAGVLARLYDSATTPVLLWLSFALLLFAVGMIRARSAHADGDEIAAFTLVGLTGAVIGPVSDTHKLIWVLPAILILVDAAARQRVTERRPSPLGRSTRFVGAGWAAAAVLTYLLFLVAPIAAVGGNAYALALILLVNALPWRPGVAPAFPINRWMRRTPSRFPQTIPPARRPTGS